MFAREVRERVRFLGTSKEWAPAPSKVAEYLCACGHQDMSEPEPEEQDQNPGLWAGPAPFASALEGC